MDFGALDDSFGPFEDELGEEYRRKFHPKLSPMHRLVEEDQLIVYNAEKKVRQLHEKSPYRPEFGLRVDRNSVVVSIDGACRGNGTHSARASWGVYFGPQSPHNACGMLNTQLPQTSTRAEIEALWQALGIIQQTISADISMSRYYVITDSSYLARTFGEWMEGWIDNGGKKGDGGKVKHFETLKKVYELLEDMTYGDDGGMDFKFWLVSRGKNQEADALANEAFDPPA